MAQSNHHRSGSPAADCRRYPEHTCRLGTGLDRFPWEYRSLGGTRLVALAAGGEARSPWGRTRAGQAQS
jgi:hypothetical protein